MPDMVKYRILGKDEDIGIIIIDIQKLIPVYPHPDKYFLGHILRLIRIMDKMFHETVHFRIETLENLSESFCIPFGKKPENVSFCLHFLSCRYKKPVAISYSNGEKSFITVWIAFLYHGRRSHSSSRT